MKEQHFSVNQSYFMKRTVTNEDMQEFAKVSGDFNPIHIDAEYAQKSIFKKQIAHGILSAAYISAIIGTEFPGIGTIYLEQNLKFLKPIYLGDTIELSVIIKDIRDKGRALLQTNVKNSNGELVVEGEALVKLPR